MQKTLCTVVLVVLGQFPVAVPLVANQTVAVSPSDDPQENPVVSGNLIAWQEFNQQRGDYDIVVADMNAPEDRLLLVINDATDQMNPALWSTQLVWQEFTIRSGSQDWDIYLADLGALDRGEIDIYVVSGVVNNDEQWPAIHGNTVVWQDGPGDAADIYAADITYLDDIREFPIAVFDGNQVAPVVWRDQVVWQDDAFGDWDIFASDIWLRNAPQDYAVDAREFDQIRVAVADGVAVWQDNTFGDWDIVGLDMTDIDSLLPLNVRSREADQSAPAIDVPWVVYQDNRAGDWDIYATHIETGQEIQVTRHPSDQTRPAISGNLVVWQDNRTGVSTIYAGYLDVDVTALQPVRVEASTERLRRLKTNR